jgi:SAM-dependent methyltransferase
MATAERWKRAQQYEASYWISEEKAAEVAKDAPIWYGWRAEQLVLQLQNAGCARVADGSARVIEVGSGPVGVARYFPATYRMAVDPLDATYAANPLLSAHRNGEVDYREGRGEALPGPTAEFDLAIIENCIDHVQDMDAVMRELHRVLKPGGILYLTVNCRAPLGYWVHRALSRTRIDAGHPHTFTPERAQVLMERHGFDVHHRWNLQTYEAARAADLASGSSKDKMKALLGVSEFAVALISERRGDGARNG